MQPYIPQWLRAPVLLSCAAAAVGRPAPAQAQTSVTIGQAVTAAQGVPSGRQMLKEPELATDDSAQRDRAEMRRQLRDLRRQQADLDRRIMELERRLGEAGDYPAAAPRGGFYSQPGDARSYRAVPRTREFFATPGGLPPAAGDRTGVELAPPGALWPAAPGRPDVEIAPPGAIGSVPTAPTPVIPPAGVRPGDPGYYSGLTPAPVPRDADGRWREAWDRHRADFDRIMRDFQQRMQRWEQEFERDWQGGRGPAARFAPRATPAQPDLAPLPEQPRGRRPSLSPPADVPAPGTKPAPEHPAADELGQPSAPPQP